MYQVLLFKFRRHLCKGSIGPLHELVTWYGINYAGTQATQWNFKTKESRVGLVRVPLFWKLRPSIIFSVPCGRILQGAYYLSTLK